VAVSDWSFEDVSVQSEGQLPDDTWQYGDDANLRLVRPPTALGPNVTASGQQYVFEFACEQSQDGFWQDVNITYMAGASYQFSVALGLGRNIDYNSIVALEFRTTDNVPVASRSLLASSLPKEQFAVRSVQHTVPVGADYVDAEIRLGFRFSGTGFSPGIDAPQLCITALPT
jgi:hypothetical protein